MVIIRYNRFGVYIYIVGKVQGKRGNYEKKIVAMLLVGAMALSITACGGDKEPKKENNAKTEATEKELKENDAVKMIVPCRRVNG